MCENCFNGCADIISDQCVKYTGIDVIPLDIHKGDTLYKVEEKILESILNIIAANAIVPIFDRSELCSLITELLPAENATLNQILSAVFTAICSLKTTTNNLETKVSGLNATYSLGCLPETIDNSDTHDVVQGLITKICTTVQGLAELGLDLHTNYVLIGQINSYIASYLTSSGTTVLISSKMVPYAVQEYYGPLSYFDATGAGVGDWAKVYLCNGENGTPDKRGRVAVGVTTGMLGGSLSVVVDPALPGNPSYTIGATTGTNTVILSQQQLPSHTHTAVVTDNGHKHDILGISGGDNSDNNNTTRFAGGDKNSSETGFYFTNTQSCQNAQTNVTVVNNPTGGGLGHPNAQPGIGCYFIQYRP